MLCTPLCTTSVDNAPGAQVDNPSRSSRETVAQWAARGRRTGVGGGWDWLGAVLGRPCRGWCAAPGTLTTMSSSLANLLAATEEHTRELPMPPIAFGAVAFLAFLALLGVLWAFRGTANKLAGPRPHQQHDGGAH